MEVSQDNIKIAQFVAKAIGFKPQVYPYWDNDKTLSIDILDVEDPINKLVKFYCTIGVSDSPNLINLKEEKQNIPVEILFSAYSKFKKAPNILASSSFYLMKNRWYIQPGTVFKDIVNDYYPTSEMKHLLFTRPFLWYDKLSELQLETKKINWLFMIPVSQKELEYKLNKNTEKLENLLQEKEIDIFDLERRSVL